MLIQPLYLQGPDLCHYKCASDFRVTSSGFRPGITSAALEMTDLSQGAVGHVAQDSRCRWLRRVEKSQPAGPSASLPGAAARPVSEGKVAPPVGTTAFLP